MTFQLQIDKNSFQFHIIFIGMNPVREGSRSRTKEQIHEVRHTYLDLDEEAGASLQAIRTSGDVPPANFVLDTSPGKHQVVWRVEGLDTNQAKRGYVYGLRSTAGIQQPRISPGSFVFPDS